MKREQRIELLGLDDLKTNVACSNLMSLSLLLEIIQKFSNMKFGLESPNLMKRCCISRGEQIRDFKFSCLPFFQEFFNLFLPSCTIELNFQLINENFDFGEKLRPIKCRSQAPLALNLKFALFLLIFHICATIVMNLKVYFQPLKDQCPLSNF